MIFSQGASPLKGDFSRIKFSIASPESILAHSRGEVLKPETINYRTFKPERDGLMCEKIFGPTKDWECYCGKYKRVRYKGIICDRCGVEVTTKSVRRERMGHISLAVPVVHTWFFRSVPSKIGALLDLSTKELERIIYYEVYVVINPGEPGEKQGIKKLDRLTEEQYFQIITEYEDNQDLEDSDPVKFVAKMGGEAIHLLLKSIDLDASAIHLRKVLKESNSEQKRADALKRLKVVEAFRKSYEPQKKSRKKPQGLFPEDEIPEPYVYEGNKPEYMVMEVVPVIPPELRPLVPLEGGRFATSDLNDLYRRVIIRNNRLKKLIDIRAPEVILRNEKRMLQEAVDALFDNSRKANAVKTGESNRPLKSLSDALKGKQGRFRQNLLGKRVDYSGRSVIVVGPELKLHECGLPKSMAIELFQPFVIRRLVDRGIAKSVKSAKKLIDKKDPIVWDVLEKVIDGRPVLLNRAPTLHRLGIQAFQPLLVEGKAIQIHPLVCTAFNADFDGDQMAVHIPLSQEAQLEASLLMLSSHNLILPQSGKPVTVPSQDMVLGMYYLTKSRSNELGEGQIFYSSEDVLIAFNEERVGLHAQIFVQYSGQIDQKFDPLRVLDTMVDPATEKSLWLKSQIEKRTIMLTTVGRVIFNQHVPHEIGFINRVIDKKVAKELIGRLSSEVGNVETAKFLDNIKEVGFHYAMKGGLSVGLSDAIVPETKVKHIKNAQRDSTKVVKEYNRGTLTDNERYNQIVDVWQKTSNIVAEESYQKLKRDREGFNPLYMMLDSGARGSREQVRQLTGMRGLIARPQKSMSGQPGEIIENPIISNLKEGLTVLEYFISTHGARKGLSDTSLKTADAGYLTRRLHDVAQDVIVTIDDCGTTRGLYVHRNIEEETSGQIKFREKIKGRVAAREIVDSLNNKIIVNSGEIITEELAELIQETPGVEEAEIRSVLTCESKIGICSKCYGTNLSVHGIVEIGEAVGVIAAQSIGEPGTQLTLRTFHQGGTAQGGITETETKAFYDGQVQFEDIKTVDHTAINEDGVEDFRIIVIQKNGKINIADPESGKILKRYIVPHGAHLHCKSGSLVKKDQLLFSSEPNSTQIIAELPGIIKFADIEKGVTYKEEVDPQTGFSQHTIINWRTKLRSTETREPRLIIIDPSGEVRKTYPVPIKSNLYVEDGQKVNSGDIIAKVPRNLDRVGGDITAGLPKVTELFEARIPTDPAIVTEIDGYVSFGSHRRSSKEIKVKNDFGEEKIYYVQVGKHVLANEGDEVKAGDPLTDGAVSPQDILRIQGPNAVQQYLVNEIQKVYQINAGVEINDKHLEVIVRQMLQKVRVEEPGDTELLPGDLIDRSAFVEANRGVAEKVRITEKGDAPARIQDTQLHTLRDITKLNRELRKNSKNLIAFEPALQATSHPVLLGITSAALQTESVISAASFQETTKVLTDAAVAGKIDYLAGLKENVIVGKLIPAGTGLKRYKAIKLTGEGQETASSSEVSQEVVVETREGFANER